MIVRLEDGPLPASKVLTFSNLPVAVAPPPDRVGQQRAADMVYSGRPIPATETFRIGLVSRLASEGVEAFADRRPPRWRHE